MPRVRTAAIACFLLLTGAKATGPELAHPGRAVDPSHLPTFGAPTTPAPAIDWTSIAFMALWATVVVTVLVLWYRRLRFDEDLESGRPRLKDDQEE